MRAVSGRESGGTNVKLNRIHVREMRAYYYSVSYIDQHDNPQTFEVTQQVNWWGKFEGDLMWKRVSNMSSAQALMGGSRQSKEQLIGEMDAEIRRLWGVLAAADSGDSLKSD